ncbi:MAG: (d)CMP kinase [Ardenticatenales bacterium]|nr:(d)CMP kinase [Ardenticatenales bacterium]
MSAPDSPPTPAVHLRATLPRAIAIDGPAAVGKSTVGRALADRLGYLYFDTGAIYRALTWLALENEVPVSDGPALAQLATAHPIIVQPSADTPDGYRVTAGGRDITDRLRAPAVDAQISAISQHAAVRAALLDAQRAVADGTSVVMVGRDIGTIVLPDAGLKIFLEASPIERARRRYRERLRRGESADWSDELASTVARDARDRGRANAPLVAAPDAIVLHTDDLDAAGVVAAILAHIDIGS